MSTINNDLESAICVSELPPKQRLEATRRVCQEKSWNGVQSILTEQQRQRAKEILLACSSYQIMAVPLTDERYPARLSETDAPPPVLYAKGAMAGFCDNFPIAIVGARAATIDACNRVSAISETLATSDVCVVSGLALGVDGAAHRGALRCSSPGKTAAVVAHGLDMLYPASHAQLSQRILDSGGVIVSEYPPGTKPLKHHFLARNRIIAGLSQGVLVAEAGSRSGSLVTAQYALDAGRDVFALLAQDGCVQSAGCQNLIEDGAIPVSTAGAILREYDMKVVGGDRSNEELRKVVIGLGSFMEITGVSFHELLRLELDGIIERTAGNSVRVSAALVGM